MFTPLGWFLEMYFCYYVCFSSYFFPEVSCLSHTSEKWSETVCEKLMLHNMETLGHCKNIIAAKSEVWRIEIWGNTCRIACRVCHVTISWCLTQLHLLMTERIRVLQGTNTSRRTSCAVGPVKWRVSAALNSCHGLKAYFSQIESKRKEIWWKLILPGMSAVTSASIRLTLSPLRQPWWWNSLQLKSDWVLTPRQSSLILKFCFWGFPFSFFFWNDHNIPILVATWWTMGND